MGGAYVGKNVRVVGPIFFTTNLHIEANTFIGRGFSAYGNGEVYIGENCDLAPDIAILTGSHNIGTSSHRAGPGISYTIKIESGCWVGARSTLTGNTTIGQGAVIACGSVVIRDVRENTLVAGVPAKEKKAL